MPRVGTCKDCGARFKVPDSTTATRVKCAKCGGVVEIPPAGGAAPTPAAAPKPRVAPAAAPAAAPKPEVASSKAPAAARKPEVAPTKARAKAPATSRPAAPVKAAAGLGKSAPTRTGGSERGVAPKGRSSSKAAGEKPAGARRSSGSTKKSRRGPAGDNDKDKGSPVGMIVGSVIVVAALGGGAWWLLGGDDTPTSSGTEAPTAAVAPDTGATAATALDVVPAADSGDTSTGVANTEAGAADGQSPAVQQAPAPISTSVEVDEPLPTLLEFEVLPPLEKTTQEELDSWTALIKELYVDQGGATGRQRKRLKDQLDAIEAIDAVPAYINALNGVDFADDSAINGTFNLVKDWQERVGFVPRFYFSGDVTDKSVDSQNKRVIVILKQWIPWWLDKTSNPMKLEQYREDVAAKLKERGGD